MRKIWSVALGLVIGASVCLGAACWGARETKGESLQLFINNGHYFDGREKDGVWKEIEKRAGVEFSVTGEAHSGSYYTKLSPLMNTLVDAPDIAFVVPTSESLGTSTFVDVWCSPKNGLLYSFEEMLGNYPEGTYPYIEKMLYESQYKNIVQNGRHYLLPNVTSACSWGIYYRTDWLIAAGYYTEDDEGNRVARYPETMDEFTDVLEKFSRINTFDTTGMDPKMLTSEGKLKQTAAKTYGYSPASRPHSLMPIYHAFGVTPDWDIYGDTIDYMYTNEKFRGFLEWASDMYAKGYIYPTFNSLASDGERQLFYDGQIGVLFTNAELHVQYIMKRMYSLGVGDYVGFGPAPKGTATIGEEGSYGFSDWGGYWGGFCVSKTCNNVEGALKLFNYLLSPEGMKLRTYGIEGTHYTVENGEITLTEENIENRMMEGNAFFTFEDENGENLPTGNYELGAYFGGNVDWEKYETSGLLQAETDAYSIDRTYTRLVQDALDRMVLKSSKLVNFTSFANSTASAMNAYADTAKSYVNSVIIGANGYSLTEWDSLVEKLKNQNKYKAMFVSANDTCREYGFLK